jgi:hypothetical protein
MIARILLAFVASVSLGATSGQAAILKSYDFTATTGLGDTLLNGNDLIASDGTVAGGLYSFAANQGLRLTNALPNTTNYAIEMRLRFDDCIAGWAKLIDFQDKQVEAGLYIRDGQISFYPISDKFGSVTKGSFFTLGLERAGGMLTTFLNGTQIFSIADYGNALPLNNVLNFVVDDLDNGQPGSEGFAGAVDYIRIHDDRSTFAAVPVPASLPLLAAGLGLFGLIRRAGSRRRI